MLTHRDTVPGLSDGGAHVGMICDGSFLDLAADALDARPHARAEAVGAVRDPAPMRRDRGPLSGCTTADGSAWAIAPTSTSSTMMR
ncbi:hypothetical protein AB5I41_19205 [Sphingomonas sp. MMS24-JH45]